MERVAAKGAWGTVEWAVDKEGSLPARADYEHLDVDRKAKMAALFQRLAEVGRINNREQFRNLGEKSGRRGSQLWEFKRFQDRFLGDFRPGRRFLIAAYEQKKKDRLDSAVIDRAVRILIENDRYEAQHGR
ncbi:MAG TPA: hypothetical protein VEC38_10090 [Candidatus Binataceae bacterium]|nr:hypothetical protein [Candidatus Binataceae bacterium]